MMDSRNLSKLVKKTSKNNFIIKHKYRKLKKQLDMIKKDIKFETKKWDNLRIQDRQVTSISTYINNCMLILLCILLIIKVILHYKQ